MRRSLTLVLAGLVFSASLHTKAAGWGWPLPSTPPDAAPAIALPALSIDPASISVSGISSGGFMAVQLHLAHSGLFSAAASVAGGIYWCAEGSSDTGQRQCMNNPSQLSVQRYIDKALEMERAGKIDPLKGLADSRVYLFASPNDFIIKPEGTQKLKEFYSRFVPESRIKMESGVSAAHGFPTLEFGNPCAMMGVPWLLKCGFDTAGAILEQSHGKLADRGKADPSRLKRFDQAEFVSAESKMFASGWLYVPARCDSGSGRKCKLHVALHGCQMNPDFIQDKFAVNSGFNEWAEANDIVVLYPQSAKSDGNPYGCWDWFGFTGKEYVSKDGPQLKAIRAMVGRLSGR